MYLLPSLYLGSNSANAFRQPMAALFLHSQSWSIACSTGRIRLCGTLVILPLVTANPIPNTRHHHSNVAWTPDEQE